MPRIEPPKITRTRPKTGPKQARTKWRDRDNTIPLCKICGRPPHKARVVVKTVESQFSEQKYRKYEEHESKLGKETFYIYTIQPDGSLKWYGKHWRLIRKSKELFCSDCKHIGELIYERVWQLKRQQKIRHQTELLEYLEDLIGYESDYRKDLKSRIPDILVDEDILYGFKTGIMTKIGEFRSRRSSKLDERFPELLENLFPESQENANQIESSNNSGTPIARHATGPNREENE